MSERGIHNLVIFEPETAPSEHGWVVGFAAATRRPMRGTAHGQ